MGIRPDGMQAHMAARRRNHFRALAGAVPQAMAPNRAEAAPGLPFAFPPHAQVAAAHDLPRQPGLARGARQEQAMDPFYYAWGAQADQVQVPAPFAPVAPVPAQVPGVAPAAQPHVGYGMGQMMQFGPFGNGVLDQAMDLARIGPAIRRGMPPHNYFDVQRPQDAANPNLHRPARVAREIWPVNLDGPRQQNFDHFDFPDPLFEEAEPVAEPLRFERELLGVPYHLGVRVQPDPASPPPEQGRGIRDDPIVLSSPLEPDLVDFTIGMGEVEAARKIWDHEDNNLWQNILDIDR